MSRAAAAGGSGLSDRSACVFASEAKQVSGHKLGCFVAFAPRNADFHGRFRRGHAKRPRMSSPVARLVRLFMMAVLLAFAAVRPAAADDGPSVLRDTETEQLFKDMSRPLIQAWLNLMSGRSTRESQPQVDPRLRGLAPLGSDANVAIPTGSSSYNNR